MWASARRPSFLPSKTYLLAILTITYPLLSISDQFGRLFLFVLDYHPQTFQASSLKKDHPNEPYKLCLSIHSTCHQRPWNDENVRADGRCKPFYGRQFCARMWWRVYSRSPRGKYYFDGGGLCPCLRECRRCNRNARASSYQLRHHAR